MNFTAENTEENHAKNIEKCIRFVLCDSLRFPLCPLLLKVR